MKKQTSQLNIEHKKKKKKKTIKNTRVGKAKVDGKKLRYQQTQRHKDYGRKNPPKTTTSYNQKIRQTKNYHAKKFGETHFKGILAKTTKPSDRTMITDMVNQIFSVIDFIVDKKLGNEDYLRCIRTVLRAMQNFLKKAASVNYNLGVFLKTYGYDDKFLPEDALFINSPQWTEVIANINMYLSSCDADLEANPHQKDKINVKANIKKIIKK